MVCVSFAKFVWFIGGIDSWVIANWCDPFENLSEEPPQFADRSGFYLVRLWHTFKFGVIYVASRWPYQFELEVFVARHVVRGVPGGMPGSRSVVVDREVKLHLAPLLVFHLFGLDVVVVFLMRNDCLPESACILLVWRHQEHSLSPLFVFLVRFFHDLLQLWTLLLFECLF